MAPAQPPPRILPANEYRRVRWRNGAGWTREICALRMDGREAANADDWDWRLSIAEIEGDAPFSAFPGVDRELVLLSGNGLELRYDDGEVRTLLPPHGRARFPGERPVAGALVDGRTEDFNLMWRRDAVRATLWHRPLVGAMVVFVEAGTCWALHLVAGQGRIDGDAFAGAMQQGDTALLSAGKARTRYVVEGGGELLLVRIEPAIGERDAARRGSLGADA
jgi:uncharacterized protein